MVIDNGGRESYDLCKEIKRNVRYVAMRIV